MGVVLLIAAVLASVFAAWALWHQTDLPAEPRTRQRPRIGDLLPRVLPVWALAIALWAGAFAEASSWWLAIAFAGCAAMLAVGPVGLQIGFWSAVNLDGFAVRHSRERQCGPYLRGSHDAKLEPVIAEAAPTLETSSRALIQALNELYRAAAEQAQREQLRDLAEAFTDENEHPLDLYRNPLDGIRIWHNAALEWLALLAMFVLRGGLVASASALPPTLTSGVVPRGTDLAAWIPLVSWSTALALAAPICASAMMDLAPAQDGDPAVIVPRWVLGVSLNVELGLLLVALAFVPSWVILASVAVVWNCANRLGDGFSWTLKVPTVLGLASVACLASLLAHGAQVGTAIAETAAGVLVGALISSSFSVFFPVTLYVIAVVPLRARQAGQAAKRALINPQKEVEEVAARLRAEAQAARGTSPQAAEQALAVVARARLQLDERWVVTQSEVLETVDRIVRERLSGSALEFDGAQTDEEVAQARWHDMSSAETRAMVAAIGTTTTEAARHGRGQFVLQIRQHGGQLIVLSRNARGPSRPGTGQGSGQLAAYLEILGTERTLINRIDRTDNACWTVSFCVPATVLKD